MNNNDLLQLFNNHLASNMSNSSEVNKITPNGNNISQVNNNNSVGAGNSNENNSSAKSANILLSSNN